MLKKSFVFVREVWVWPGVVGWHFVTLPKKLSGEIKKTSKHYGSGFVKVKVTIGKSSWVTALFPHKESGSYLLSIKKNIRKREEVFEGDRVKVSFNLI